MAEENETQNPGFVQPPVQGGEEVCTIILEPVPTNELSESQLLEQIVAEYDNPKAGAEKFIKNAGLFFGGLLVGWLPFDRETYFRHNDQDRAEMRCVSAINGITELVVGAGLIAGALISKNYWLLAPGIPFTVESLIRGGVSVLSEGREEFRPVGSICLGVPSLLVIAPFGGVYELFWGSNSAKRRIARKLEIAERTYAGVVFHEKDELKVLNAYFSYQQKNISNSSVSILAAPSKYVAELINNNSAEVCYYLNELRIRDHSKLSPLYSLLIKCVNYESGKTARRLKKIHKTKLEIKAEYEKLIASCPAQVKSDYGHFIARINRRRDTTL